MTIERLDSAMGGLTQALANLGGAVADVTAAAGGLTESLGGLGSQGPLGGIAGIAGPGGADGSAGKGDLFQKIQRLIDALSGADQGDAAKQGNAANAKPNGADASTEAPAPDAENGAGTDKSLLQLILQMVLEGLKSGQLTDAQARELLAQVGQPAQGSGQGASGNAVAAPQQPD